MVVDRQCDAAVTIGVCDVVEARMQKVAIQFSFEFVKKVKYLFARAWQLCYTTETHLRDVQSLLMSVTRHRRVNQRRGAGRARGRGTRARRACREWLAEARLRARLAPSV